MTRRGSRPIRVRRSRADRRAIFHTAPQPLEEGLGALPGVLSVASSSVARASLRTPPDPSLTSPSHPSACVGEDHPRVSRRSMMALPARLLHIAMRASMSISCVRSGAMRASAALDALSARSRITIGIGGFLPWREARGGDVGKEGDGGLLPPRSWQAPCMNR